MPHVNWQRRFARKPRRWPRLFLKTRAVGKKDADMILELVKTSELTHPQKSWALIQAARFLTKTDRDKAALVIVDGLDEARRIEELDPDRPRALMNVANALLALDRSK